LVAAALSAHIQVATEDHSSDWPMRKEGSLIIGSRSRPATMPTHQGRSCHRDSQAAFQQQRRVACTGAVNGMVDASANITSLPLQKIRTNASCLLQRTKRSPVFRKALTAQQRWPSAF
jgi:hypothetical protein